MNKWGLIAILWPAMGYATDGDYGLYAIGAALAITIAAAGGAIGQGRIGASAMEGIARNPQAQKSMFISMILGLAFIESIMIYALVVSIMIIGKM